MSIIPALWRLRQKDSEAHASMDYTMSSMQAKHFVSIPENQVPRLQAAQRLPVNRRATHAAHMPNTAAFCSATASLRLVIGLKKATKRRQNKHASPVTSTSNTMLHGPDI